ncbi:MAG TPA: response regulator, partial [Roseimicrobium sp.]|nr:response regulator [Roseimicrobium sp.]
LQLSAHPVPAGEGTPGGCEVYFAVRDTGIGIPADKLKRLFNPFMQVDASTTRNYGGTGLGLAISRSLVEMMGGQIWAESTLNQGSVFQFKLPLAMATGAAGTSGDSATGLLSGLRLLVVDDNETNRRILSAYAARWGMTARLASKGAEAMEWLRGGEFFDVGILDMQMPEMDGVMLASEIRGLPSSSSMPLVLLTSLGRQSAKDSVHFAASLPKPVKPAQLHAILLQAVSGNRQNQKTVAPASRLDASLSDRIPVRILLVDDNLINQKVAVRLLQQMGYRPDTVSNGMEALKAVESRRYDLVFMDVQMPEMDGLEATRMLRVLEQQAGRDVHRHVVVAMTANAMAGDRERCLDAGMDDYIAKPVRPERIRETLERWGPKIAIVKEREPAAQADKLHGKHPHHADAGRITPPAGPVATSASAAADVDTERLEDFSNGEVENLKELVSLYLNQTREQLAGMQVAIGRGDVREVERLAHSALGASATCGMKSMAVLLRELEQLAHHQKLAESRAVLEKCGGMLDMTGAFLDAYVRQKGG